MNSEYVTVQEAVSKWEQPPSHGKPGRPLSSQAIYRIVQNRICKEAHKDADGFWRIPVTWLDQTYRRIDRPIIDLRDQNRETPATAEIAESLAHAIAPIVAETIRHLSEIITSHSDNR